MPAAIDTTNGKSLFATFREVAWHGLGTVFTQTVTDYVKMLKLAGLNDWNVRFESLSTESGIVLDDNQAVVRTNPVDGTTNILGVVGNRYGIVQNEEAFSFLQSLQDGARWETAGSLKGGQVVFGSLAFDREIVLDPTGVADVIKSYLLVHTSHDGSTGIAGGVTPVRVVCQNTLNVAKPGLKQTFKIRHTATAEERMMAASELWRAENVYMDTFEIDAKKMFETTVTDKRYFNLVTKLFPKPEADVKGALAKWENRFETYSQAWKGEPNAGIKNTAWGALNALTEANQWGRKVQTGRDTGQENFFAAGAGFDGPTNQFRNHAYALCMAL